MNGSRVLTGLSKSRSPDERKPEQRSAAHGPSGRRLSDIAYEKIKRLIICMEYRPGSFLNAAQVGAQVGAGITPVNQALNRLMIDGMVELIPRKGAIVRPISLEEILNIVDVRMVIETYCVRLAAERARDDEIARLFTLLEEAEILLRQRDVEGLMLLDREFHIEVSHAARNPVLAEMLLSLHERSLRVWFTSLSDDGHLAQVQHEHRDIAGQLRARDAIGADAAMRLHIESFRSTITGA
ncbi:MAG: GntR family transcriptional regulator [Burkholderiales bacterium]|nr:GntR family transcriptional regulator [Burkholderiales bacterium]